MKVNAVVNVCFVHLMTWFVGCFFVISLKTMKSMYYVHLWCIKTSVMICFFSSPISMSFLIPSVFRLWLLYLFFFLALWLQDLHKWYISSNSNSIIMTLKRWSAVLGLSMDKMKVLTVNNLNKFIHPTQVSGACIFQPGWLDQIENGPSPLVGRSHCSNQCTGPAFFLHFPVFFKM